MTSRIPLIVNAGAAQIQELALTDDLVVVANIQAGGILTDNYYYANGSPVVPGGSYSNADVATFLASGTDTQNIITTANVSAAFFIGDGGYLSNIAGGIEYVYQTSNYSVVNNQGVLANTAGGVFTVTLPATPATGDQCVVADAGGAFGTNNLTVARNGSTIEGIAQDLIVDITGVSVQLIYDGSTWQVYSQVGGAGGTASNYGNANVAAYLPTYTGNLAGGNVLLSGTISRIDGEGIIAILPSSGNTVDLGTTRLLGDITPVNAMGGNVGTAALPFFSGQFVNVLGDTITSTGEITGAHFIGEGGNLSNITAANITGQVANSLVSGTVYEAAQPNITSVGTLVDLTTVGNITAQAGGFFIGDGGFISNINVTSIPAVYFNVTADGNNQTFSNIVLSAYTSNTDITLFYNGALLDSPYYTLSGDTITVNTELQTGDSIDIIRQFASNVVASTYGNSNVYSYLESGSVGNIVPAGNNISSLGSPTNQFKDVWVSNATIYFDGLPLSVDANAEITFNGLPLVSSDSNLSITTTGNVDAGNIIANGAITANGNIVANTGYFFLGDGGLLSNIAAGSNYSNANVASYLPTYTGNLDNVDAIATTGNITVGTGAFFLGDGGLLSNVASDYGNSNVAAYLPTYTGNLDNVDTITANVISSNATIIANSVTLGSQLTPVSTSQWVQLTTASAVPVVLMTIPAADVTHVDFNVVATDATTSSRQVSKLMAINYNSTVDYNEYGSLLIGTTVGDFTISTDGTDIFLNVIPVDSNSVDYNVVAMIYY
jgi:hypothetical protein